MLWPLSRSLHVLPPGWRTTIQPQRTARPCALPVTCQETCAPILSDIHACDALQRHISAFSVSACFNTHLDAVTMASVWREGSSVWWLTTSKKTPRAFLHLGLSVNRLKTKQLSCWFYTESCATQRRATAQHNTQIRCHATEDGFPFESDSAQGFFLLSFSCSRRHRLARCIYA